MKFSLSLLHKSASYWLVLAIFGAANTWSWLRHSIAEPPCCDEVLAIGFPFPFYLGGELAGRNDFLITGFLLDIVVAWTLAVCAAWIALMIHGKNAADQDHPMQHGLAGRQQHANEMDAGEKTQEAADDR